MIALNGFLLETMEAFSYGPVLLIGFTYLIKIIVLQYSFIQSYQFLYKMVKQTGVPAVTLVPDWSPNHKEIFYSYLT